MSARRLFIDAGNTRVKWSLETAQGVIAQGSVRDPRLTLTDCAWQPPRRPAQIWVSCVAGANLRAQLSAWAQTHELPAPRFVAVQPEHLGLTVAYRDVSRLGVDRYLAMLGARRHVTGAVCVADIGTALTIDTVAADGRHLGGLIAPGPMTMVAAVLEKTAQIRDGGDAAPPTPFARDTGAAVRAGAIYAAAGLIERMLDESIDQLGDNVTLLVTGGGRAAVVGRLRRPVIEVADLVFAGLRAVADNASVEPGA